MIRKVGKSGEGKEQVIEGNSNPLPALDVTSPGRSNLRWLIIFLAWVLYGSLPIKRWNTNQNYLY